MRLLTSFSILIIVCYPLPFGSSTIVSSLLNFSPSDVCTIHLKGFEYMHLQPEIIQMHFPWFIWTIWTWNNSVVPNPIISFHEACSINIIVPIQKAKAAEYSSQNLGDYLVGNEHIYRTASQAVFIFIWESCFSKLTLSSSLFIFPTIMFLYKPICNRSTEKTEIESFPNFWFFSDRVYSGEDFAVISHTNLFDYQISTSYIKLPQVYIGWAASIFIYEGCFQTRWVEEVTCDKYAMLMAHWAKYLNFTVKLVSHKEISNKEDSVTKSLMLGKIIPRLAINELTLYFGGSRSNFLDYYESVTTKILYCSFVANSTQASFIKLWSPLDSEIWIMSLTSFLSLCLIFPYKNLGQSVSLSRKLFRHISSRLFILSRLVLSQEQSMKNKYVILMSFGLTLITTSYRDEITSKLIAEQPPIIIKDFSELLYYGYKKVTWALWTPGESERQKRLELNLKRIQDLPSMKKINLSRHFDHFYMNRGDMYSESKHFTRIVGNKSHKKGCIVTSVPIGHNIMSQLVATAIPRHKCRYVTSYLQILQLYTVHLNPLQENLKSMKGLFLQAGLVEFWTTLNNMYMQRYARNIIFNITRGEQKAEHDEFVSELSGNDHSFLANLLPVFLLFIILILVGICVFILELKCPGVLSFNSSTITKEF